MESNPADLNELLENGFWLVPLARALAQDVHSAEDLVQDTWLAAAGHPPSRAQAGRSWLRTVLRHRALTKQRETRRRARREHLVARHEAVPSESQLR